MIKHTSAHATTSDRKLAEMVSARICQHIKMEVFKRCSLSNSKHERNDNASRMGDVRMVGILRNLGSVRLVRMVRLVGLFWTNWTERILK